MSNPSGFTVRGKWYPAKSIVAEQAMLEHIRELEAENRALREAATDWEGYAHKGGEYVDDIGAYFTALLEK